MELPGESYFYTLAQVGITFAGFSALLIAVQQMRAVGLSGFHKWVARIYIQSGLATTANAMVPPLLFDMGLSESMTWRATSLFIVGGSIYRLSRLPGQWYAATNRPLETRVKVHVGMIIVLNSALVLNAVGWPLAPSGAMVMFVISWNLFAFFFQFAESIRFFFEDGEDVES